jgi:predicted house-cleaning noncanonical NTP pyrophosphatase (MazG superfamily)
VTVSRKLVRDRIPDMTRAEGRRPVVEVLAADERRGALLAKLVEEATEAAGADGDGLAEELADVVEVVRALAAGLGLSLGAVTELADRKASARGGFERGVFLVEIL